MGFVVTGVAQTGPHVNLISQTTASMTGCNFPNSINQPYYDTNGTNYALTTCYILDVVNCAQTTDPVGYLPANRAFVGVTNVVPPAQSLGLIILFSGDGGTSFFTFPNGGSSGVAGTSYAGDYHGAGYTIAQVEWRSDWNDNTSEPTVKSLKDEACRPDTLMRWLNAHVSQGGYTCAQGHSGGGGEIAYAMEFYGADRNSSGGYLNEALFTSGPAESDLKAGCQYPQTGGGAPISVCSGGKCVGGASTASWQDCLEYTNASADCFNPQNLYFNDDSYDAAKAVSRSTISDTLAHGNNCNNFTKSGMSTSMHDADWAAMSLVTNGTANGIVSYPKTWVSAFMCSGPTLTPQSDSPSGFSGYVNVSNNSAAQSWSYVSLVHSTGLQNGNGTPSVYRVDYCAEPEMIWADGSVAEGTIGPMSGFQASESDMILNCKVGH